MRDGIDYTMVPRKLKCVIDLMTSPAASKSKPMTRLHSRVGHVGSRSVTPQHRTCNAALGEVLDALHLRTTRRLCVCYATCIERRTTDWLWASSHHRLSPSLAIRTPTYANDPDDYKSVSGYVTLLGGNVVSYASRKQSINAQSTCEAEYIAMNECTRDLLWFEGLLDEVL
ncbi:hypothetical protein PF002_g31462 [Phytophthora fragariae]|uniref:Reverse transcriptase Ty1/copia-type domain-containing protein n=1 Tax=Phytophthora fragariae TaxID=53985 RepID=A0A6A3VCF9_9STRA|nr:hypothetical protein PF002_g31462 [Phytophthora fragariae]